MKILLFITTIDNLLNIEKDNDYEKLINNLEKLKEINKYDAVYISICDYTQNSILLFSCIRKILEIIRNKDIYFGRQFLNDVYYNDIKSGALLYENGKLDKINEIIKYIKDLSKDVSEIEIITIDNDINRNEYKNKINSIGNHAFSLLNSGDENIFLENLYKIKKLQLTKN